MINLKRNTKTPLTRQIYEQLRMRILKGDLKAGERLPSSRELAISLNVSRIIVVEAYELLMAEGFLESVTGSGTYVAAGACLNQHLILQSNHINNSLLVENSIHPDLIDFRSGIPALELFPRKKWASIAHQVCLDAPETLLSYDQPEGRFELREVIAAYLGQTRGVACDPGQILITSGSVQGLVLVAQTLLSPTVAVMVEDPANRDIRKIFSATGARVIPVTVDELGIRTDRIYQDIKPGLIQVTPSHQFPLGGNLPIQRRIELVEFARTTGCYLVEDDYDSEFRYQGPPVSSLQGLDPDKVIYLGTFSKILFPALRIGYLVAPWELVDKFRSLKRLSDMHTNSLNQLTLAQFIREGHLQRHIFRMKKVYQKRRDALINSLQYHFPEEVKIIGAATGLHLVAEFINYEFNITLLEKIAKKGLKVYPVESHSMIKGSHIKQLIFGYGHLKEELIEKGIKRFREVF